MMASRERVAAVCDALRRHPGGAVLSSWLRFTGQDLRLSLSLRDSDSVIGSLRNGSPSVGTPCGGEQSGCAGLWGIERA
jgi:hypothetical protein